MAIRKRKPTSPGRRFQTVSDFSEITKSKPEKSLLVSKSNTGGRNSYGRKTARHKGGAHKRQYRIIDFKRTKDGVEAKVASIEYDPNRTCRIALLHYIDGTKSYILAPKGLEVGMRVESDIPVGTTVHNVELRPGAGGQLVRSAGSGAQLMAKEGKYATLRLPSGEMRKILLTCRATIGQVGNLEHENESWGKAGKTRWLGRRPQVRGVAMNPRDHPHGGGEGQSPVGRKKGPVSATGVLALGYKTRRNKSTDKFIVRRRK